MNITFAHPDSVKSALGIVSGGVAKATTMSILKNVLIETTEDSVWFTTCDLARRISYRVRSDDDIPRVQIADHGRALVDYNLLQSLCNKGLPGQPVSFKRNGSFDVVWSAQGSDGKIKGLDPDQFPNPARTEARVRINAEPFYRTISQTVSFVANDTSRPILAALHLVLEGDTLVVEGADGFRLAHTRESVPVVDGHHEWLVEKESAKALLRMLKEHIADTLEICTSPNALEIRILRSDEHVATFTTQLLEGRFPDTNAILPRSYTTELEVNVRELELAVTQALIFDSAKLALNVTESGLQTTFTTDQGDAECQVAVVNRSGPDLVTRLAPKYLKEALDQVETPTVRLAFNAPGQPIGVFPMEGALTMIIMPMG